MNDADPIHASRPPRRRTRFAACIALLLSAQVQAESVNKCRIDGRVVFQSSPCPLPPPAAASAPSSAASEPTAKQQALARLLRQRDAGARQNVSSPGPQADGAKVLRTRMGAM